MSRANPLWGAPRIQDELLKLGLAIAQRTVAKYMIPRVRQPPSQNWKTFLRNHLSSMVSVDFLTVPTLTFHVYYALSSCRIIAAAFCTSMSQRPLRRLGRPNNSGKPSPSSRRRSTCCATGTAFTACSSNAAPRLWDWRKSRSPLAPPGSRLTSNG